MIIIKEMPNPKNNINILLNNNPIVVPKAKNKIIIPDPDALLSVGSISIVVRVRTPNNPQKETCIKANPN